MKQREFQKTLEQLNSFNLFRVLLYSRWLLFRQIAAQIFPHWFRAPRLVFLASYLFIIWVVMATIILIASQDMQVGVVLFGLFVVPLYATIRYTSGLSKRAHWVGKYGNL